MSGLAALLAFVDPTAVVKEPEPVPAEGIYAAAPLVVLILLFFGYLIIRSRRRPASARRKGFMSKLAPSTGLGNALVELNAMFDPNHAAIVQMDQGDCDRDPEQIGDDRDPDMAAEPEADGGSRSGDADIGTG